MLGGHQPVVRLLVEAGADVNAVLRVCGDPLVQARGRPDPLPRAEVHGGRRTESLGQAVDKPGVLKLAGLFPDKIEVSGPNGGPIPVAAIQRVIVDVRGA